MRYSYEFKKKCVEMYKQGKYPDTPSGVRLKYFHDEIRNWVRIVESCGFESLKHKNHNKSWSPEERFDLVSRVLAGESIKSVAFSIGMDDSTLGRWVYKYKTLGYNGLVNIKRNQSCKEQNLKTNQSINSRKLNESEYEELIRLRKKMEYIKYIEAENEIIKKEIALRERKEAARLKAKKQRSSKNSEKTDIN